MESGLSLSYFAAAQELIAWKEFLKTLKKYWLLEWALIEGFIGKSPRLWLCISVNACYSEEELASYSPSFLNIIPKSVIQNAC